MAVYSLEKVVEVYVVNYGVICIVEDRFECLWLLEKIVGKHHGNCLRMLGIVRLVEDTLTTDFSDFTKDSVGGWFWWLAGLFSPKRVIKANLLTHCSVLNGLSVGGLLGNWLMVFLQGRLLEDSLATECSVFTRMYWKVLWLLTGGLFTGVSFGG